jgi:hypothetical protein
MSLESNLDESIDERRQRYSREVPESWIHRNIGKPRKRIDLVDVESLAVFEEEVDPSESSSADALKGADSETSDRVGHVFREHGWGDELGAVVYIFILIVIEGVGWNDFADLRSLEVLVAQDGAFQLPAGDPLLDHQTIVEGEGFLYSHLEMSEILDLGDAHARPACAGLDEYRCWETCEARQGLGPRALEIES